jgi:(1->4)-alpha-D-glucan 1-alpha-D-glucosylmutase
VDDRFRAAYRLQLLPHLDFERARELVPYLRELGVSHLYLSPSLEARAGSAHGYDVVDPTRLSSELGGEAAFRLLCEAGLGVILDVVPNHMAASRDENPFWRDPLMRPKFFDLDWRTGDSRRFFDIDDLAGVRVEDPEVFETTHRKVLELVRDGLVDGLRIDHVDGLANPRRYLERLREAGVEHVWVEKILEGGEPLRGWPVEGTTGYEFANETTAVFVDAEAEEPFSRLFAELTGDDRSWEQVSLEARLEQARTTFASEVEWLERQLNEYDAGVEEAVASLPVYRTYVDPDGAAVDDLDRRAVAESGMSARLSAIMLLEERGHDAFVVRFQQTTPPVYAKGVEDTAYYRYNRLVALNEVGGDPGRFSLDVEEFHRRAAERARRFPLHLLTTQTHDTKRSGDVRARIVAMTWFADEWRQHVLRWRSLNAQLRTGAAPDANEEYLLYQTLVGAWPIDEARLVAYLEKALREGKTNTSWTAPNVGWEDEAKAFAAALLGHAAFLAELEPFAARIALAAVPISLGQSLLKLTAPGVPDIYQGDEDWCFSLVDPDNRRRVDWDRRRGTLARLAAGEPPTRETAKLFLTWKALELRSRRPDCFAAELYDPLDAGGDVCAFARGDVVVAVPVRLGAKFDPPAGYEDVLGFDLGVRLFVRS